MRINVFEETDLEGLNKWNVFQEPDLNHLNRWTALFFGYILTVILAGLMIGMVIVDDDDQYLKRRRARTPTRTISRPLARRKAA